MHYKVSLGLAITLLFGGCGVPPTAPLAQSESTTSVNDVSTVPGDAAADSKIVQHRVPEDSFVIGINEHSNYLVLGSQFTPRLSIYDLDTQSIETIEIPFVPNVGVDLGPKLGLAVFGYSASVDRHGNYIKSRGDKAPTTKCLIVRDKEVIELELAEPITATNGVMWDDAKRVILVDSWQKTKSLVYIDAQRFWHSEGPIRLGRRVLKDSPHDIDIVHWRYLGISYAEERDIEILDLDEFYSAGYVHLSFVEPRAIIEPIQPKMGLFAALSYNIASTGRFEISRVNIDVFELNPGRGGSIDVNRVGGRNSAFGTNLVENNTYWGALHAVHTDTTEIFLIAGYSDRLFITLLDTDFVELNLKFEESWHFPLPISWISRIDSTADGSRLFVSSLDDGIVVEIDMELLLAQ